MKRIKMRHLITVLTLLSFTSTFSQNINATYKVTNYSVNGENFDDLALGADVALSFYMCDSGISCFANMWRNSNSQSYGSIHAFKARETPETSTEYPTIEFQFTWKYYNTYDSKRGNAAVTFTNIIIGNTGKFVAEIVDLDTNDRLVFKGYLEN